MATRFYLSSGTAAAVNPPHGAWDVDLGPRLTMSIAKDGSSSLEFPFGDNLNHPANTTILGGQFVSAPMAAGVSFASTDTFKCYIRCRESGSNDDINRQPILIRVMSENGQTTRATLKALGHYGPNTTEWATTARNKTFGDGDTLGANYTTVLGDRLVVEVGGQLDASGGNTVTGFMTFGSDNATDLGENETDTSAFNPWFEISTTITFHTPLSPTGLEVTGEVGVAVPQAAPTVTGVESAFEVGVASLNLLGEETLEPTGEEATFEVGSAELSSRGTFDGLESLAEVGSGFVDLGTEDNEQSPTGLEVTAEAGTAALTEHVPIPALESEFELGIAEIETFENFEFDIEIVSEVGVATLDSVAENPNILPTGVEATFELGTPQRRLAKSPTGQQASFELNTASLARGFPAANAELDELAFELGFASLSVRPTVVGLEIIAELGTADVEAGADKVLLPLGVETLTEIGVAAKSVAPTTVGVESELEVGEAALSIGSSFLPTGEEILAELGITELLRGISPTGLQSGFEVGQAGYHNRPFAGGQEAAFQVGVATLTGATPATGVPVDLFAGDLEAAIELGVAMMRITTGIRRQNRPIPHPYVGVRRQNRLDGVYQEILLDEVFSI